ncbi:hypothetical protein GCM10008910_08010 [Faecalicatena orotica]|jgi:hypothetical protein|uniref:Uncharacterized protein n=1 Tax=Faecalicatena orotica TaxID=1544 RepID=A0A2Y9BHN0_9FIRM|nr:MULTISPECIES: hypothetical protein [Clostridia]PWJ23585.1 hypothetical protein A8806_11318 [Faecalicatena orotica]SSA57497.1 hypothetical protein SAMN05216536_11318 [Faecalicatena orotica]
MIIIEIEVPMMGKLYDFQIDENVPLSEVMDEAAEMICQKEQCPVQGDIRRMLMWNAQNRVQLAKERTAAENGLWTGSRILLV